MSDVGADLYYDPNDIGPDGIVGSLVSLSPRDQDETFDPSVGDYVELIDHDGVRLRGRVTEHDGDSVRVQVRIPVGLPQTA